ncbi:Piwi domain-containing protein [Gilbertella persicaria]|uniref:Piwi domain-containing protein n=1 Tax=Gilbertella persicaria TaxID=101096 RepID=UPI00221E9E46|nr:Piwi domain-containing protein [Gilbertella persicaria]KAI8086911.1 Piwi domain-containing protein [Gilbertella persicaria]
MATDISDFVLRPNVGSSGRATRVRSNFFQVQTLPTCDIYHYDVAIDPPQLPIGKQREVWKTLEVTTGEEFFNGAKAVFDGRRNIFSSSKLRLGEEQAKKFDVNIQEGRRVSQYSVRIKKVGVIDMKELPLFLNGKSSATSNCLSAIMVLDILIRNVPTLNSVTIGRSFYSPKGKKPLSNATEVWQGYYQSARPTVGEMMINIDVSATAFWEPGPLPEQVVKILNRRSVDELRNGIPERERLRLTKIIKAIRIEVTHRGGINRKYKIRNLTDTSADDTFFEDPSGKQMSVTQYFFDTYKKRLTYPFLPCVVVGQTSFLPMEVCNIFEGQRLARKLNQIQTAEMIKFTCQNPAVRANKINQGFAEINYRRNEYMQNFGMTVDNQMALVDARVLPAPRINYSTTTPEGSFVPSNGVWSLRGKRLARGVTLGSWSIVNFAGNIPQPAIQRFVRELCQTFVDIGLNVIKREPPVLAADPQGNIDRSLKEAWLRAGHAANAEPQLIVCVLPNTGTSLYAEIKRITDTVIGVSSQCLQSKHIRDAKKQYCANVALKVNIKLGGINSYMEPSEIPFISERPTIVFGADVVHPPAGDTNKPSIAALIAYMDSRASRCSSTVRVQTHRTENIVDLGNMVKELLKSFYQSCGQKPERILFYRDGVSEGQFKNILENEVSAIRAACASLNGSYKPSITFVVAQKRHHARFFPLQRNDADRSGNCQPGTVIDTNIVHPFEFDFYLQSHAGLQGTSRSTHYHVLYDDNHFTADSLQELTYRLCYTYGRATRSVSLVPAAYYADLVAARARFHFRGYQSFSESTDISEAMDISNFAEVKPALQRVMYFM